MGRIFINHPKIGTIAVPKTRPGWRSKRYELMRSFVWRLAMIDGYDSPSYSKCKHCNKILLNPQSILLHIGNGCESTKQKK